MNIDLTKPNDLPCEFKERLRGIRSLCEDMEFSDELVVHSKVVTLVEDINQYCERKGIIGYHYTRAIPDEIVKKGLLIRVGHEIREKFIADHSSLFTDEEIKEIKESWERYFSETQRKIRDSRIFFNFTLKALGDGGANYLLGMYGGEQVSMGFEMDTGIGKKLCSIGQPIIVRCLLNSDEVKTFTTEPWGKVMVSSYHKKVNPEAYRLDLDAYQSQPVPPDRVELYSALTKQIHTDRLKRHLFCIRKNAPL